MTEHDHTHAASLEAGAGTAELPEKQCGNPECLQMSAHDAGHCWLCNYDFSTGTMPRDMRAEGETVPQAPLILTVPAVVVEAALPAVAAESVRNGVTEGALEGTPGPGILQPRVVSTGAAYHETEAVGAAHHEIEAVDDDVYGVAMGQTASVPNAGAVVTPYIPSSLPANPAKLDVEPSAISIPVLDIVHPARPHVVILVDRQPRRSRPATESPPDAQEPIVVELTGEAHAFGKLIKSFSLGFDRFASSVHGYFQRDENGPGYSLRDESTNGTKLNGRYIAKGEPKLLRDGDVITFGAWSKLVYFAGGGASASAAGATTTQT
jgi:hypothetical protein